MKKSLIPLLLLPLLFASCDSGSDDGGSTGTTKVVNSNANDASVRKEYARLEFPHLSTNASNYVLIHTTDRGVNYSTEWDALRKTQRWSCYALYKYNLEDNYPQNRYASETDPYPSDPLLDTSLQWTNSNDPYWGSGFDHGHICPSGDRQGSATENYQTFFITNMQPQFPTFNREGVWVNMESFVRTKAKQNTGNANAFCDTLYVCKGGTIASGSYNGESNIYKVTNKGLIVPRYFYMALLAVKNGSYYALAFWVDQYAYRNSKETRLAQFAISIDELERRTGIDFFCNLPDERENKVEAQCSPALWGLN